MTEATKKAYPPLGAISKFQSPKHKKNNNAALHCSPTEFFIGDYSPARSGLTAGLYGSEGLISEGLAAGFSSGSGGATSVGRAGGLSTASASSTSIELSNVGQGQIASSTGATSRRHRVG
jgi:hypothetical protein